MSFFRTACGDEICTNCGSFERLRRLETENAELKRQLRDWQEYQFELRKLRYPTPSQEWEWRVDARLDEIERDLRKRK